VALANFLFRCYFNNRCGYFRDEFDRLACGDHLAWGYVDHPPLVPFLIKICRRVLGDSLRSALWSTDAQLWVTATRPPLLNYNPIKGKTKRCREKHPMAAVCG
jgi:hypothetical protein